MRDLCRQLLQWSVVTLAINAFPDPCIAQDAGHDYCTLRVTSLPDSAEVFLDGQRQGLTPLLCVDLTNGTHFLKVIKNGFIPFVDTLDFDQKTLYIRDAVLVQAGMLFVDSDPTGADVAVNNVAVGKTPVLLTDLRPEIIEVSVSKSGHAQWKHIATIQPGKRTDMSINLKKIAGLLTLKVFPENSEVLLDGKLIGIGSLHNYGLPSGKYELTVRESDGMAISQGVFVPPGGKVSLLASVDDFNTSAIVASCLVPGLGQILDRAGGKGVAILAGFAGAAAFTIAAAGDFTDHKQNYEEMLTAYRIASSEDDAYQLGTALTGAYDEMAAANSKRNVGLIVMIGIYGFNVVDAILHHSSTGRFEVLSEDTSLMGPTLDFSRGFLRCRMELSF